VSRKNVLSDALTPALSHRERGKEGCSPLRERRKACPSIGSLPVNGKEVNALLDRFPHPVKGKG